MTPSSQGMEPSATPGQFNRATTVEFDSLFALAVHHSGFHKSYQALFDSNDVLSNALS